MKEALFQVGDRVKCIEGEQGKYRLRVSAGMYYTIVAVKYPDSKEHNFVKIQEARPDYWYSTNRFQPISEFERFMQKLPDGEPR